MNGTADAIAASDRAWIFQRYANLARQSGAVNLAQGVPEPLTDEEINLNLPAVLKEGWQYTDAWGLPGLRRAVCSVYGGDFGPEDVLITSGCTESLYVGLRALQCGYGRQVGFFEPFYPYYVGIAQLNGLTPVPVEMHWDNGCAEPDWSALERAMRRGLRIMVLNTPHNPTGWVLSTAEARMLLALAERYAAFLIIDEAYKYFVYENVPDSATHVLYQGTAACLIAGSASKLLSATGLRIGWLLGNAEALKLAHTAHMYTTYCQPAPLQHLAAALLGKHRLPLPLEVRERYCAKRDILLDALRRTGLECGRPAGGHFVLADYSKLAKQTPAASFAEQFAAKYGVMPLPADVFYAQDRGQRQLRFSFSVSPQTIQQAASRLQ
jgi:N-succinyldiaminopimelate aminotransferase